MGGSFDNANIASSPRHQVATSIIESDRQILPTLIQNVQKRVTCCAKIYKAYVRQLSS